MKLVKLFMTIVAATLLTACGAEYNLEKAEKAIDDKEYVVAAKALNKIDGDDVEDWVEDSPTKISRISTIMIMASYYDYEAEEIIDKWLNRLAGEMDEDEYHELRAKIRY